MFLLFVVVPLFYLILSLPYLTSSCLIITLSQLISFYLYLILPYHASSCDYLIVTFLYLPLSCFTLACLVMLSLSYLTVPYRGLSYLKLLPDFFHRFASCLTLLCYIIYVLNKLNFANLQSESIFPHFYSCWILHVQYFSWGHSDVKATENLIWEQLPPVWMGEGRDSKSYERPWTWTLELSVWMCDECATESVGLFTSWCRGWFRSAWCGTACSESSCCERWSVCRFGKTYPESRSCWPSGCWDAGSRWDPRTADARRSTSGGKTRPWCTPADKHQNFIYTQTLMCLKRRAVRCTGEKQSNPC